MIVQSIPTGMGTCPEQGRGAGLAGRAFGRRDTPLREALAGR